VTEVARAYWDNEAAAFDDEPDHGLRDPAVRRAWADLLLPLLAPASRVADLGCGTGSLSVLLAEAGHRVDGVDLSQQMVDAATAKAAAAGVVATFVQGDASQPPLDGGSCDVVLARHVLWALPEPVVALRRWCALLRPAGTLVLVEGSWSTGAGLTARDCESLVREVRSDAEVRRLIDPSLWGREIDDERYLLVSRA
jgi:ubiquinone/menaquinone biosynthesis C-methylase UbiE